jgi:molecular chaperone DnaK (HSP70)
MARYRIGIDLGTTNSVVAYTDMGRERVAKVEQNEYSSAVLPSCVAWSKDGLLVGARARREYSTVAREFKRDIGSDKTYHLGGNVYTPVELSSLILRRIKESFEREVGEIEGAVITVPANFTDRKRAETKEAGRLAGLDVLRIINEPSAAAIAYARSVRPPRENTIIIDWGGGTLDVSLVDCDGDVLDIKANDGDERCGGADIDEAITQMIISQHKSELAGKIDVPAVRGELVLAAEQIKIYLAGESEWNEPINLRSARTFLDVRVTRDDLNRLAAPLIDRVMAAVERCLAKAPEGKLDPRSVSEVLLVGGSSKMPALRRRVTEKFGRDGRADIDPMEVVALGAAYQAEHATRTGSLVTLHSLTHALGTSCLGRDSKGVIRQNLFDPILEAGMKLPATATKTYHTVNDNQTAVDVDVYEALIVSETADGMTPWGPTTTIDGIPKGPAGSVNIEVTFSYSLEQELSVAVQIPGHGIKRAWKAQHRRDLEGNRAESQRKVDSLVEKTVAPLRDLVRAARTKSDRFDRIASGALADLEAAVTAGDIERAKEAKARLMDALFELGISLDK